MDLRVSLLGVALALACSAAWLAPPAAAAPRPDESEATRIKLFREAQRLYERTQFEAALARFRLVDELMASPNARLYQGRCLRELGRLPEAFEAMSSAVDLATQLAEDNPSYLRTRDAAAAERERIVPVIGRVIIVPADPPADLEVEVNGRLVEPALFGRTLGVEPGEVRIEAVALGYHPFTRSFRIPAGTVETIALAIEPRIDEPNGPSGADPKAPLRAAGFVTASVGAASMVVFAVTGAMANARYATIEAECGSPPCTDPAYTEDIEQGRMLDAVAYVGLIVGLAGLVGGTTMIVLGWPDESSEGENADTPEGEAEPEQAISIGVVPGGAGVGLGYQLRF